MIVITQEVPTNKELMPGDMFQLSVKRSIVGQKDSETEEVVACETFTKPAKITYACIFHFANNDGFCLNTHAAGFFGDKDNLPREIRQAVKVWELPRDRREVFESSWGFKQ